MLVLSFWLASCLLRFLATRQPHYMFNSILVRFISFGRPVHVNHAFVLDCSCGRQLTEIESERGQEADRSRRPLDP